MMKKILLVAFALTMMIATTAYCSDFIRLTDEIELDYTDSIVKVFVVVPAKGHTYSYNADKILPKAQNVLYEYVRTLTFGKEMRLLGDEMDNRPVFAAKVEKELTGQMQRVEDMYLPRSNEFCSYFLFDLKLLRPIIADLNMPKK